LEPWLRRVIGWSAILAPSLHLASDGLEWLGHGFSPPQLIINYLGFLLIPAMMLGLYAVQRPRIARMGLLGAVFYGFAFIYFTYTTLLALSNRTSDYTTLWVALSWVYTVHGAIMIVGGLLFAAATIHARVLPAWAAWVFAFGLAFNLILGLLPAPAIVQTLGSTVRNVGLIGMGIAVLRLPSGAPIAA
jgi:hypothetical protein